MNLKKEVVKVGLGILYIVGIVLTISWLKLSFWGVYALFLLIMAVKTTYAWIKHKKKPNLKELAKNAIVLLLILTMFKYLFKYLTGTWGFLVGCLIIGLLIVYRRRTKWFEVKHKIEKMIWGKPLKEFKTGKELPKVKFVLKK